MATLILSVLSVKLAAIAASLRHQRAVHERQSAILQHRPLP